MIIINKNNQVMFFNEIKQYHRINGPAYVSEIYQEWCQNDKTHRIGGPAVIDGEYQAWYINNEEYTETEYHNKLKEMI